jgi:predicted O-methyltransferase YrrM
LYPKYYEALAAAVRYFKPLHALEIGLWVGRSAYALLNNSPNSTLISIDPVSHEESTEFLEKTFPGRFTYRQGYSPDALYTLRGKTFDWVYIDGEHTEKAVTADLLGVVPLLDNDGVIVLDDYNITEVREAVDMFMKEHAEKKLYSFNDLGFSDSGCPSQIVAIVGKERAFEL